MKTIGEPGARKFMADMDTKRASEERARAAVPQVGNMSGVAYEMELAPPIPGRLPPARARLRVGEDNSIVALWMRDQGFSAVAIITSTNPGGNVLDEEENGRRFRELLDHVRATGYEAHMAESTPGCWHEDSETQIAVPGASMDWARATAERFGQVAFVWIPLSRPAVSTPSGVVAGRDTAVPELIVL